MSIVHCLNKKTTPCSEIQFFCLIGILLYNWFLSQLQYCRDIRYHQMNDILMMIRGLQFHHNLMWEI